jgi:eukaryotic-like serine/threonine-protein kinase
MPAPGEMIGGRYRLDDRIAAGGMGEVWRATDTVLARDVAVKTLHAGQAGDPGFQERFRHEARAMAALHHPGIADVYDYGQTGDGADAYIVMARVVGRPLNELIAARGRLGPAETMSIVAQAGRALDAAHQAGIVHRDVKPGNLIIRPDGTVVLVDFGVARSTESAALTGAREVVGTALYIAPEQVSKETTGPPADVYALGAVAYHCLAGRPPFLGENPIAVAMQHVSDQPPELPADVPGPVRALVARAMAKDPAARYPSAAAMAEAADSALTGGPAATMAGGAELAAIAFAPGVARYQEATELVGSRTSIMPDAAVPPARPGPPGPGTPAKPARRGLIAAAALVLAGLATLVAVLLSNRDHDGSPAGPVVPSPTSSPLSTPSAGNGGNPKGGSTRTKTTSTRSSHSASASASTRTTPTATTTPSTTPATSSTPSTKPTTEAPTKATTTPAGTPATTEPDDDEEPAAGNPKP